MPIRAARLAALARPREEGRALGSRRTLTRAQWALVEARLRSRMLLQVHDELVFEVAPGERDTLEALVRAEMGGAAELTVPLDVSVGTGASWHDAAH